MKKILTLTVAVCAPFVNVFAAAQDWSGVSTDVTTEIAAVMPVALTIFGAVIAVAIGKKVFRRIAG